MKSPVKRSSKTVTGAVDGWLRTFRKLALKAHSDRELDDLLYDLLTPQERISVAERVGILEGLVRGTTLREVAKKVHVSLSKVERGSNVFQYGKVDWKKALTPLLQPPR